MTPLEERVTQLEQLVRTQHEQIKILTDIVTQITDKITTDTKLT